jgi:glutaredoxin
VGLLTEDEAAKLLQIEGRTLAKIRRSNSGTSPVPFVRIGGQIRYHEHDIMEWARQQKKPPVTKPKKPKDGESELVLV